MVAMPLADLQLAHAKLMVGRDLLRERAQVVARQGSIIVGLKEENALLTTEVKSAKASAADAWVQLDQAKEENGKLAKKLKRRTPWAVAMKVQLGAIIVFGGYQAYRSLMP